MSFRSGRVARHRTVRTDGPDPLSRCPVRRRSPTSGSSRRSALQAHGDPPAVRREVWALATRFRSARSRRWRSPNTRGAGPRGTRNSTVWFRPPRADGSWRRPTRRVRSRRTGEAGVRSCRLDSVRGRGSRRLRCCIRSALRSIVSSIVRRCSAVDRTLGRATARERSHDGDRRAQLMGDDRQEVGSHPLQVLHRHGGVGPDPVSISRRPRLERTYSRPGIPGRRGSDPGIPTQ